MKINVKNIIKNLKDKLTSTYSSFRKLLYEIINFLLEIVNNISSYFTSERDSDGAYFWHNSEMLKLEEISMKQEIVSVVAPFFYKTKNSKKILQININKCAEIDRYTTSENYFFKVLINFRRKKKSWIIRDFEHFDDAISYIKKYIDPIDIDLNKFNL